MVNYQVGEIAYLIESNRFIREGKIVRKSQGCCLFRFIEGGGIRVQEDRLYPTEELAQKALDQIHPPARKTIRDLKRECAFFA